VRLEITTAAGRSATAEPDEIAAILAVMEALEDDAPQAPQPKPSRWRTAARSFEADAL
jgi:hypothetical protein